MKAAIFFGNFGPYHHARVVALQKYCSINGVEVFPVQVASSTSIYAWKSNEIPSMHKPLSSQVTTNTLDNPISPRASALITLFSGVEETISPFLVFIRARILLQKHSVKVAFLPSYSPLRYFALFAAAYSLRIHTVMMNDSHAKTASLSRWKKWFKQLIVKRFDAALVAGKPHKRHFNNLGIPSNRIFTGYDAVDNTYFSNRANLIRLDAENFRHAFGLPPRFFLSLGRMVSKKNLIILVEAYAMLYHKRPDINPPSLVFVGSGELESTLKSVALSRGLRVIDRYSFPHDIASNSEDELIHLPGSIYFYGFRQIEDNPVFYALSDAFILPSLHEEWGLVVNEAMACSLPVIVSETVGCVEDLLPVSDIAEFESETTFQSANTQSFSQLRRNGYVFNPASASSLFNALQLYLSLSDEQRLAMADYSRSTVELFSCENFARQAFSALQSTLL